MVVDAAFEENVGTQHGFEDKLKVSSVKKSAKIFMKYKGTKKGLNFQVKKYNQLNIIDLCLLSQFAQLLHHRHQAFSFFCQRVFNV